MMGRFVTLADGSQIAEYALLAQAIVKLQMDTTADRSRVGGQPAPTVAVIFQECRDLQVALRAYRSNFVSDNPTPSTQQQSFVDSLDALVGSMPPIPNQ
jgi:hypothetical protein